MALTQVTVTGTFNKAPGVTSVGNLQWQLSTDLFNGGQPVANRAPISFGLVNGAFSVTLWAVDDPGTSPSGAYWVLSGTVDGEGFSESYAISHSMAPTIGLSQLTPVTPSPPVSPVNAQFLQGFPVAPTQPSVAEVFEWDGTTWSPTAVSTVISRNASLAFAYILKPPRGPV